MKTDWNEDLERLRRRLEELGPLAIAFSGGQDSSLLVAVARQVLGRSGVLALTADSPAQPRREVAAAGALAERLDVEWLRIETGELELDDYRANPPDRCYHCKRVILTALERTAHDRGFTTLADGSNASDVGDYRPGARALAESGVNSPLKELGVTKPRIRALLKHLDLPTWDKPAAACLSSRVPYDTPITPDVLARIEGAESLLQDAGFALCRARHHGDLVRIEVATETIQSLAEPAARAELVSGLKALGYRWVALDLEGYRTGSLNEALDADE